MKACYFSSSSYYMDSYADGKTHFINLIDCKTDKPIEGSLEFAKENGIKKYGPKNEAFKGARKVAKLLGYKVVPKNERTDYR